MKDIKNFVAQALEQVTSGDVPQDLTAHAMKIGKEVSTFLDTKGVGVSNEAAGFEFKATFDDATIGNIDGAAIVKLVEDAGVPERFHRAAVASVAHDIAKNSANFDTTKATHFAHASSQMPTLSVEDIMPATMKAAYVSNESFGAYSDKAVSDLATTLTVSLLKWHGTLTPRVIPNITKTDPVVSYIRPSFQVYGTDGVVEDDVEVVDLYGDPSPVVNSLKKVVPLNANDATLVPEDGIVIFGTEVKLLELALDASKVGYGKVNRTDIVADNVTLESVYVILDDGTNPAETYKIDLPVTTARLTRPNNQPGYMRSGNIQFQALVDADTKKSDGTDGIVADGAVAVTEAVAVALDINVRVDTRNGAAKAMGDVTLSAVGKDGSAAASGSVTAVDAITASLYGYTLDARYSEENMRKSDVAITEKRDLLNYEIFQGRNFLYDAPILGRGDNANSGAAKVYDIIRIGQDKVTLDTIIELLNDLGLQEAAYLANPVASNRPGNRYVSGSRVKPTFISATLDFASIVSFDDAYRLKTIAGRTIPFLNNVTSELLTKSYFDQQLDGAAPIVFKLITSGKVKGNILGNEPKFVIDNRAGAELTIKLPNGIILEVVTTTFDTVSDRMILIPSVSGDSELNFAHNIDCGTLVGSFTHSDGGNNAVRRMVTNVREQPIPCNVMGAIIDVTGIDNAMYR